jgi:hypothetical protein
LESQHKIKKSQKISKEQNYKFEGKSKFFIARIGGGEWGGQEEHGYEKKKQTNKQIKGS